MSAFREIFAHFGIEVDTEELKKGTHEVENFVEKLKGVGEAVMAAFAVEKVKEFVMGMAESAEKLELQALTLGVSTGALQEWQFAASMSGIKADALTGAMMRLEKGGKAGAGALAAMGLSAKDAHGKSKPVTDLMDEIADKMEKIEDPTKRAEMATKLWGKTGQKMIPMFEHGSKGIKKYRDEVKELGGGLNEDFIKKSKEMLQQSHRLNMAWESFKVNVVGTLLPVFTTLVMWLTKGAVWLGKLASSSSILETAWIALGVAGAVALSSMLGPLGALLLELAPLIIAFLVLEDIITFFRGGDSLFGDALNSMFGTERTEAFRKGILEAIDTILTFFDIILGNNTDATDKWKREWEDSKEHIIKGFGDLGRIAVWFIDLFTGGWSNAKDRVGALFTIIGILWAALWDNATHPFVSLIHLVEDMFARFTNGILDGIKLVLKGARALAEVAGQTGIVEDIDKGLSKFTSGERSDRNLNEGQNEFVTRQADRNAALLAAGDTVAGIKTVRGDADTNGTGTRHVENKNTINVHVPSGTPHGVAQAAGEASEEGMNRANAAALIPGGDDW